LQCKKFDKTTRKCTAHNDRPQLCRNYPWYGKEPKRGDTTMGGRCSFLVDAGYKMLPIVEVRNGKSE
jgi:Fe-S-cluster containining protein